MGACGRDRRLGDCSAPPARTLSKTSPIRSRIRQPVATFFLRSVVSAITASATLRGHGE